MNFVRFVCRRDVLNFSPPTNEAGTSIPQKCAKVLSNLAQSTARVRLSAGYDSSGDGDDEGEGSGEYLGFVS